MADDKQNRMEALARVMCAAYGNDPDSRVVPSYAPMLRLGGKAEYAVLPDAAMAMPAWTLWAVEAEIAVNKFQEYFTMFEDAKLYASEAASGFVPKER